MPIASYVLNVPPSGTGAATDISALVGSKTVVLTGFFSGSYTLLASHDNVEYVPVLLFDASGEESIKQTLDNSYKSVRLRSNATAQGVVACSISGLAKPGENLFASLFAFVPGGASQSPIINTFLLFPPTGLEQEINFICSGSFTGAVVVEGSLDGSDFNTIGIFQAGPVQKVLVGLPLALEFSPLSTENKVHYLRITLQGQATSAVGITLGGRILTPGASVNGSLALLAEDDGRVAVENNTVASTEVILYETETNLASAPANVVVQLNAIVQVQGSTPPTGRFRVYLGATAPGDTAGSVLAADSGALVVGPEAAISVTGLPVLNPGGACRVQVTGEVSAPGVGNGVNTASIRGVTVYSL